MTCASTSSQHDGLDPLPVLLGLSREVRVLCSGCRRGTAALGLVVRIVERRVGASPVEIERRRSWRPAWLRHLTNRDETGRIVA